MPLWRITPTADADDGRWLDGPRWGEVIVRADRAAEARVAAAKREAEIIDFDPELAGGQAMDYVSSFHDEKLYHVAGFDAPDGKFDAEGPTAVLSMEPDDLTDSDFPGGKRNSFLDRRS